MATELFAKYELPEELKNDEMKEVENWYDNEYLPTVSSFNESASEMPEFTIGDYKQPFTDPPIEAQNPKETIGTTTKLPIKSSIKSPVNSQIVQYFMDKGLTENQARGIYGNIMQESGGKLSIVSRDGHSSYGLAQWTGDRKKRLFSMYGNKPTKQQQLDFLWWELNNTHTDALNALKRTSTVAEATKVFMDKFEKPHKNYANLPRRINYAQGPLKALYGIKLINRGKY